MTLPLLPIAYYQLPPLGIALLIVAFCRTVSAFSLFVFAGTFVHEVCHLAVGGLLGAKPTGMNLLPKPGRNGATELGSVTFRGIRWWNAIFIALAPLLGIPLVLAIAYMRVKGGWAFSWIDLPTWAFMGTVFLSCWPSRTDWMLSLRSWPLYVAAAGYALWPHLPFA